MSAAAGVDGRDGVWEHPDLLPVSADLDDPAGFIDGIVGGGTSSFDDPIAQLEATEAQERSEREAGENEDGENDGGTKDSGSAG